MEQLYMAGTAHPDLEALFQFYEQLLRIQFAFKAHLRKDRHLEYMEGKEIDLNRMASGIPQVSFDDLQIKTVPFIDLYSDIATLLLREARYPPSDKGEPQPEAILARMREIFDNSAPLVGAGQPTDVIRTTTGLVLAPFVQLAAERTMPRLPQDLWHRGYCPVCGGTPSFAGVHSEAGFRTLLCSRCHAEWRFRRMGCPFCLERDHQTFYPGEEGRYRLYVCEACHRYLKSLDMRESSSECCLPIEALITVFMDVAAQEKGYLFF